MRTANISRFASNRPYTVAVSRSAALVGLPFQQLMAFTPPNFTAWIAYDSSGYFTFGSDPKRSTCPSGSSILISYAQG